MHTLPKWAKVALPFALLSLLLIAGVMTLLPQQHQATAHAASLNCTRPSIWINDGGGGNAGIDVYIDGNTPESITVNGTTLNNSRGTSQEFSNYQWGGSSELQTVVHTGLGMVRVQADVQWGYGQHTSCRASVWTTTDTYIS